MTPWRITALAVLVLCLVVAGLSLRAQDGHKPSPVQGFNHSLRLESEGKTAEALGEMQKLAADHANDYLVNARLGWLSYLTGDYSAAERYYRKAISLSGDRSVEAMLGLTLPLAAREDWEQVERVYQQILALDALHYTANLRLGQIYLNRGSYAQAEKYLQTALAHYPAGYEANLSGAWNRYYLGRPDDARKLFERALMLSPDDTSATRGLSLLK